MKVDICCRGHERTSDNLMPNGDCRSCARVRAKSWKRAQPFPCGHARTHENTRYRVDGRALGCGVCPPKLRVRRCIREWGAGETKTCALCIQEKTVSEFIHHRRKNGRMVPGTRCVDCHNQKCREYRQSLPRTVQRVRDHKSRLKRFGLSTDEFDALERRAGGCCELCGEPEKRLVHQGGNIRALAIDHDHVTGKVRGFLCMICNTRLAWVEQVGFSKIQKYLEAAQCGVW